MTLARLGKTKRFFLMNQTRLIQAQLAVFKVPYGDDYTEPLILAVPVPQCRGIEINDH